MALALPNNYKSKPIYTTSSLSKVQGKNKSNLVGDADWKHPWDPNPGKNCKPDGYTVEAPNTKWGNCCAYNEQRIFNITKRWGYPISTHDVLQLMQNMYNATDDLAGFVMPKLPDGSLANNHDGSILCISGGHSDMNNIIWDGTYKRYATVSILTAVMSICDMTDKPPNVWDPHTWNVEIYNKWIGIMVDIYVCYAKYYPDGPETYAETHYHGSCDWEPLSGEYQDDKGFYYVDEDGEIVMKELLCSESACESTPNFPNCPKQITGKQCKDRNCTNVDPNAPTKTLSFFDMGTQDGRGRICQVTGGYVPPVPPFPPDPCLSDPSKCNCPKNPDPNTNLHCYCLANPNDSKCNPPYPGYCDSHPYDVRCHDYPTYCELHPNDPKCKGPDPVPWWDWWVAWFMDHGFTPAYLEYMAVSEIPAIYLSVHYDTWKYVVLDNAFAAAFPFVYYFLLQWYNTYGPTNPWVQYIWRLFDDAVTYWNHPWSFWKDYWYLIIPGVGIGGTYIFTLLNYQLDIPEFIDSDLFTWGFIITIMTEVVFFFYYEAESLIKWIKSILGF